MANFLDCIFCHCGPTTVRPQPDRHLRLTGLTVLLTGKRRWSPLAPVAAFCFLQHEQKMNRCVAPVLRARVQHLLYRLSTLDATGGQARIHASVGYPCGEFEGPALIRSAAKRSYSAQAALCILGGYARAAAPMSTSNELRP